MKAPKWMIALTAASALALSACQEAKKDIQSASPATEKILNISVNTFRAFDKLENDLNLVQKRVIEITTSNSPCELWTAGELNARIEKWANVRADLNRVRIDLAEMTYFPEDTSLARRTFIVKKISALKAAINNLSEKIDKAFDQLENLRILKLYDIKPRDWPQDMNSDSREA